MKTVIKYIEWLLKMTFGWLCYWLIMAYPVSWTQYKLVDWLLLWAIYYAYDDGFLNWIKRENNVENINPFEELQDEVPQEYWPGLIYEMKSWINLDEPNIEYPDDD